MTVTAPPERPQPTCEELDALIEEARRRSRRRRLAYASAVLAALLVAGAVFGVVALTGGGGAGSALPEGYHLVQARGPVQHAVLEEVKSTFQTVEAATGQARPTRATQEIWWDAHSGLSRTVYRLDGRVIADVPRQSCQGTGARRFCVPPSPFDLGSKGLGWPPRAHFAQRTGTFRGHRVVWIEGLVQPERAKPYPSGEQAAYDAVTHRPVAIRSIVRGGRFDGHIFYFSAITMLPDLPGKHVSFAVPNGGAGLNDPSTATTITGQRLPAARAALGAAPLWLGRSFRGHKLASVVVGTEGEQSKTGRTLRPARFARFDYGSFALKEFGGDRPFWREQDPAAGTIVVGGSSATFARDGFLINVYSTGPKVRIDNETALALFKALRPAPSG